MARCFERWTVLPHGPLQKLEDNLWQVDGTLPNGRTRRVMTVARCADGALVVHNAIALDDAEMKELDAFGRVAYLVVPNGFHRQDARIWKDRYPAAKVLAPRKAAKRVGAVVAVDGSYDDGPRDAGVRLEHLAGLGDQEGVMVVRSGGHATLVFNDVVLNMPKLGGVPGVFLAPTGRPSVPRFARWLLVKDKGAFRTHVERLAAPEVTRVVVGHGKNMTAGALRGALDTLG